MTASSDPFQSSTAELKNVVLYNNSSRVEGGAIKVHGGGHTLDVVQCTFASNYTTEESSGDGNAILSANSPVNIDSSIFYEK